MVVSDFDGTLTTADVGDRICARFAPPEWEEWDRRWLRGEVSLPDAQREMWRLVRASDGELRAYAREVGALRSGATALLDAARDGRIELVIASGGFAFYIDEILGERAYDCAQIFCNDLQVGDAGCEPRFPHRSEACATCGVCKRLIVARYVAEEREVIFVGDGSSDRCAARAAPALFAVAGGTLAQHCDAEDIAYTPFTALDEVVAAVTGTRGGSG